MTDRREPSREAMNVVGKIDMEVGLDGGDYERIAAIIDAYTAKKDAQIAALVEARKAYAAVKNLNHATFFAGQIAAMEAADARCRELGIDLG